MLFKKLEYLKILKKRWLRSCSVKRTQLKTTDLFAVCHKEEPKIHGDTAIKGTLLPILLIFKCQMQMHPIIGLYVHCFFIFTKFISLSSYWSVNNKMIFGDSCGIHEAGDIAEKIHNLRQRVNRQRKHFWSIFTSFF